MNFDGLSFGYVPYSPSLRQPGDRRRFCYWAAERGIPFEIARPGRRYDVTVLSARADLSRWPHHPRSAGRVVFDFIDSYLAIPPGSLGARLRGPAKFVARETRGLVLDYRRALEAMCRRADAVICSTPEQEAVLRDCSDNVHPILDAHAAMALPTKATYEKGDVLNLVWEGLPYTLDDMETIAPVLRALQRHLPIALHLVTDLRFHKYARRLGRRDTIDLARRIAPDAQLYSWNEQLLGAIVTACDIAIIPLDLSDPLARNKPENKLLLFWRMGMPAVTSATPAYRRVMDAAGVSLTCSTAAEWEERLTELATDGARRAEVGRRGAAYVDTNHSPEMILERWDRAIESVVA